MQLGRHRFIIQKGAGTSRYVGGPLCRVWPHPLDNDDGNDTSPPYMRRYRLNGGPVLDILPKNRRRGSTAHIYYLPANRAGDGRDRVGSQLFADDDIVAEPDVGQRGRLAVRPWGHISRSLIGELSANDAKMEFEGQWRTDRILLGFGVDVNDHTICFPEDNRMGACGTTAQPTFRHGNRIIDVKTTKRFR